MTGIIVGPPIHAWENEHELKMQYAAFVAADPNSYITAAYKVFPGADNLGRAMQCANWISDPIVIAEIERLRSGTDVASQLPSPDEHGQEVLDLARNSTLSAKDRIAAHRLFAEMMGRIQKAGTQVNVDARTVNVLRVPATVETPEEEEVFARRFKAQQTALVADARSKKPA